VRRCDRDKAVTLGTELQYNSYARLLAAAMRAGRLRPTELQLDAHHIAADCLIRPARLAQRIALQQLKQLNQCMTKDALLRLLLRCHL